MKKHSDKHQNHLLQIRIHAKKPIFIGVIKKKQLIGILCILFYITTNMHGQHPMNPECYKTEITPIKSIDPDNTEFADLHFLKPVLSDKQIVILGESGHGDGLTFEAKTRLIKYLVENAGFTTLAFEGGGFFEMYYASERIRLGENVHTEISNSWYNLWSNSINTAPLQNYIDKNKSSIKLLGIENQYGNNYWLAFPEIVNALIGNSAFESIDLDGLNNNYRYYYYAQFDSAYHAKLDFPKLTEDFQTLKQNILKSSSPHAEAMLQAIYNMESFWRQLELNSGTYDEQNRGISLRDSMMTENVIWWLKRNPNDKIIIWTANLHGAFNLNRAVYAESDDFYQVFQPLGHRLKQTYGDNVFSIAFTSTEGEVATIFENEGWEINIDKSSWDYEMSKHILYDYAFVNFENIRAKKECSNLNFNSTILGYKSHYGRWFTIFDGVFFIRKMERAVKQPSN